MERPRPRVQHRRAPNRPMIERRIAERDALIERLKERVTSDDRVVTAWLAGSFGRGEQDGWSDLDPWLVIRDEAFHAELRHELLLSDPLFLHEAPQNGPPGGTYLMAAYDAPTGPHLVDWYLVPARFIGPGTERYRLVDRPPLTPALASPEGPADVVLVPGDQAANVASLFWAMILIQAKWIARKPNEDGLGFDDFICSLGTSATGAQFDRWEQPSGDLNRRLDRLVKVAETMRTAGPNLSRPSEAVLRFIAFVRAECDRNQRE